MKVQAAACAAMVSVLGALTGCSSEDRAGAPQAPVQARRATLPPPGPAAPMMLTAPPPTIPPPRALPTTMVPAGTFGSYGTPAQGFPPTSPPTSPPGDDRRVRAALNGMWTHVVDETMPSGRTEHRACSLRVTANGATETCSTVIALGPDDPGWECGTSREPHTRVTESPYAVSVADHAVVFSPGVARLVSDNGCTPRPAGAHTVMTAQWDGESAAITFVNNGDPASLALYTRTSAH